MRCSTCSARPCELSAKGLKVYGGDYDFYRERKRIEEEALAQQVDCERAALRLARKKAQEVRERQERRMRQGERHKDQLPRILRRTMKDCGERTEAQLVGKHAEQIEGSGSVWANCAAGSGRSAS